MHESISGQDSKCNQKTIYNDVIRKAARKLIPDGEEGWYATYVFGIPKETLSVYLNGSRSFPAWLAVVLDKTFKTSELLDIQASAEGRQTIPSTPEKLAASELEKIFPMVLRKQGHMNGDVMTALLDHEIDTEEREHLHEHAAEMRRYYQDIEERTSPEKAEVSA